MRITFVLSTDNLSGGNRVIAIYAKALMEIGHTVRVIARARSTVSMARKIKSLLKTGSWPGGPPSQSYFDGCGVEYRVLDRQRPIVDDDVPDGDVVIATWWQTAEWVNAFRPSKGAKVYLIQGHEIFPHLPVERCHATYRMPLHKVVVSQWLRRIMNSQYDDDVVDLVPNSVDKNQFFSAPRGRQKDPTVGFLYSTSSMKGLDVATAALAHLGKRWPNLRTISFGNERPRSNTALPEKTEFHFSPPQDQLRELYSSCDAWLTASRSEGFNLTAIEAMACRTPIVATRTGWPDHAIKSRLNGYLADIDDVAGLAQGLEWILSLSDEEWRRVSAKAYETANAGSWQESARMFEKALLHACERTTRGEIAGSCSVSDLCC